MGRMPGRIPRHLLPPTTFPSWTPRSFFRHEILHESRKEGSRARVGRLHTPHGVVDTPGFVVVGTNGAVKFVDHHAADAAGMQLMFANTLHLVVHPGAEAIGKAGGLHKLMGRQRPLITDSGGFQIFSFANRGDPALPGGDERAAASRAERSDGDDRGDGDDDRGDGDDNDDGGDGDDHVDDDGDVRMASGRRDLKSRDPDGRRRKYVDDPHATTVRVTEEGATFKSYRDGSDIFLSPETSIGAQKQIGADIIIPLDDLPTAGVTGAGLAASVARTHRWEARALAAHLADPREQALYCVLHGGVDYALRAQSVAHLSALPFDGYAIGGSFGKDRAEMAAMLAFLMPHVPRDKPNHLLGMGDVDSVTLGVRLGIDTFDSSFPTRLGRHGTLLTRAGRLKVGQARYRDDYGPIDPACDGFVATNFSRAYLHHLWRAREPIVHGLLTLHNIKFMADYMAGLRAAILRDEV